MRKNLIAFLFIVLGSLAVGAQVPLATHIAILKAEDSRRYDKRLEDLLQSPNEQVRLRAALAAGRIGNKMAVPTLAVLLEKDSVTRVREMAAFAIGEIESIEGAEPILKIMRASSQVETRPAGDASPHRPGPPPSFQSSSHERWESLLAPSPL